MAAAAGPNEPAPSTRVQLVGVFGEVQQHLGLWTLPPLSHQVPGMSLADFNQALQQLVSVTGPSHFWRDTSAARPASLPQASRHHQQQQQGLLFTPLDDVFEANDLFLCEPRWKTKTRFFLGEVQPSDSSTAHVLVGRHSFLYSSSSFSQHHCPSQRVKTTAAMACRLASWVALALLLVAGFAATPCSAQILDESADRLSDAPLAKAFCDCPAFKALTCGFASEAEESATLKEQCARCGTLFRSLPSPRPVEVSGSNNYNQYAVRPISLACKGPVVVRSVFKYQTQITIDKGQGLDGYNCTPAMLHDADVEMPSLVRCELQLPNTGGNDTDRALQAKEGSCWWCGSCSNDKGCPANNNTWYSDTFITNATGCDFDPQKGYRAHRVGFNIFPFTKILVAKFEVCNSPPCFDPQVERSKLAAAKPCIKGKCAD